MTDDSQDPSELDDQDDSLSPLLSAGFAAREGRIEARGSSVVAQLCLTQGIDLTPLTFGKPAPGDNGNQADPVLPGAKAARYQILDELGRGGLGLVMRTRDQDLRREVALKVLRSKLADRKDLVERFLLEAQLGGQLQHPGIPPVYDMGIAQDGRPFFTMKLVQGSTLKALLDEREGESGQVAHLLSTFSQVCKTVGYAHSRGVVHRDLKPANVMVGEFGEVQVVDWGLAKVLGRSEDLGQEGQPTIPDLSATPQSQVGVAVGTPGYMAPEQAQGKNAGQASDVYSLGVILFEILAERPLVNREDGERLSNKSIRRLLDGHHSDLRRLTIECLTTDPAKRPADALKLGLRIDDHLASSEERVREAELHAVTESARADEASLRVSAEARARRLTALTATVVLVAVLAGGGTWTVISKRASGRAFTASLEMEEALGRARAKQAEARVQEQTGTWMEALEAARGALAIASVQPVSLALEARARSLVSELQADLAAAQVETNQRKLAGELRARLGVLVERSPQEASPRKDFESLVDMFEEYGYPLDEIPTGELSNRLLADNLLMEVTQALDVLGTKAEGMKIRLSRPHKYPYPGLSNTDLDFAEGWATFWNYAQAIDPDPQRREVRAMCLAEDAPGLWKLTEPLLESETVPAATLSLAAESLGFHGMGDNATVVWKRAIWLRPDDYWARRRLGEIYSTFGEPWQAIAQLEAATALNPASWSAWHWLSTSLEESNRLEEALAAAERARKLEPASTVVQNAILVDLLKLGRAAEVIRRSDSWLESTPISMEVLSERSIAHLLLMDLSGLRADLEMMRVIYRTPEPGFFYNVWIQHAIYNAANYWNCIGDDDKAREAFEIVLLLDPEHPQALCNLGLLLDQQFGEYAAALDHRSRGHEIGSKRDSWTYPSADWVRQQEKKLAMFERFEEKGPEVEPPVDLGDTRLLIEVLFRAGEFEAVCRRLNFLFLMARGGDWPYGDANGHTVLLTWTLALLRLAEDPDQTYGLPSELIQKAATFERRSMLGKNWGLPPDNYSQIEKNLEGSLYMKVVLRRLGHPGLASVRGEEALAKLDEQAAAEWRAYWSELEEWRQELLAELE